MKKTKPKKLLTVLLALCMVLSIVPMYGVCGRDRFPSAGSNEYLR